MARGGITQLNVLDARKSIIERGENPSIDAIRAELGHTGSKTTISNHLKAIEQQEHTQLADETRLSQPIKALIAQLSRELQKQAHQKLEANEEIHRKELAELAQKLEVETGENLHWQKQSEVFEAQATALAEQLKQSQQKMQKLETTIKAQQQEISELKTRNDDKQRHIDSLEEKHLHARESLEHYRQSVKEQRDQDLRRHEQQVQELQAEQRKLQQTLVLKQDELSQTSRENSRLFTELKESKTTGEQQQKLLSNAELERQTSKQALALLQQRFDDQSEALQAMRAELAAKSDVAQRMLQLETESRVKDALIIQLTEKLAAKPEGNAKNSPEETLNNSQSQD